MWIISEDSIIYRNISHFDGVLSVLCSLCLLMTGTYSWIYLGRLYLPLSNYIAWLRHLAIRKLSTVLFIYFYSSKVTSGKPILKTIRFVFFLFFHFSAALSEQFARFQWISTSHKMVVCMHALNTRTTTEYIQPSLHPI